MIARVAIGLVAILVVAACGGERAAPSTTESTAAIEARIQADVQRLQRVPEPMRGSIFTWYNTNGLPQLSATVWQARLDRTCNERFWEDPTALQRLGDEFVASDMPLAHPLSAVEDNIVMEDTYRSLWVMALNHCRGLVPVEAVEAGPPHFDGGGG